MSTERYDFSDHEIRAYHSGARLLYISREKYSGDWYSMPHTHPFTEFFYVVNGTGKFRIEDTNYDVTEGDLVLINPQVVHTETSLVANPLEYVVLGIQGVKLLTSIDSTKGFNIVSFNEAKEVISNYLESILVEAKNQENGYEDVCQALLNILLINLMRRTQITPRVDDTDKNANPKAVEAKRYIDEHFRENINLDTIAESVVVNKYYLSHIFSQAYGVSPLQYVQTRRLEDSKYLLRTSSYTLKQIAAMSGFSSLSYFTQRFTKVEGICPSNYRQQYQKG